jgi:lipopolysaccharide/colanic/teichoic acid biosynthesis glycosyltransferase
LHTEQEAHTSVPAAHWVVEQPAVPTPLPVATARRGRGRAYPVVKRALDILIAIAVLVPLAPVMVAIAVAVRLESPGPALFRQTRIGRHGRPFQMLKFRSMVAGADARKPQLLHLNETNGIFKITRDPRITRVGRLLRRTYLDELPQILNVLKGDMSLVGPRPLVPEEDQHVRGRHRRRLEVPPGITGRWQVLGPLRASLDEMVVIDCGYAANCSLWDDVKILAQTVSCVARRGGC